jgi:hypothetical protein
MTKAFKKRGFMTAHGNDAMKDTLMDLDVHLTGNETVEDHNSARCQ